jgi:hypothetical protein
MLMLATERATVAELNHVARDHLIARGDIARRSRTYRSPDHNDTITLAVGDEVILRRNQRLAQPGGTTVAVRNGARRGHATIQLDAAHRTPGEPPSVPLPAAYVGMSTRFGPTVMV